MDRLSRRNLFKAALGTVGAALVGKAAPVAGEVRNHSTGWIRMAEPGETIVSAQQQYPLLTLTPGSKPWPGPLLEAEVWAASMGGILTINPMPSRTRFVTDKDLPSIRSTSAALPLLHYDGKPLTLDNDQHYWLMHDLDEWGEGWEEGKGFDG